MIDYKFSLELTKNGIQKSIHAKAGESNSRKLVITLTESGKVYELNGLNAEVFFEDGSRATNDPVRVNNTFEFVLPSGLLTQEGVRICELKIKHDDEVVFSPLFEVIVEKSFGNVDVPTEDVGETIKYQEEITIKTEETDEMSDNDSFIVHKQEEGAVRRYPWWQFWKKHNKDNSHTIGMISGLRNFLDNTASKETVTAHYNEFNKAFSDRDQILDNYVKKTDSHIVELQTAKHTHSNKDTLDKLSTSSKGNLLFNGKPIEGTGSGSATLDIDVKTDTEDEYVLDIITDTETITTANLKGKQGVSGVYVGSGEMPEGFNIQIDPNGDADDDTPDLEMPDLESPDIPTAGSGNVVSPVVEITEITGGHRVTITDADGTESFDVLDGADGNDYVLTEADKTDIANAVVDLLPKYNGEVADV